MRKRVIPSDREREAPVPGEDWIDLEQLADVDLTSEDPDHPIEQALVEGRSGGWRASEPGRQAIRLTFSAPQHVRRVRLEFEEAEVERTQEFVLRASQDGGQTFQEVVRQQWNFSPQGSSRETEEVRADLPAVSALELVVTPDISGGQARASLESLRVG